MAKRNCTIGWAHRRYMSFLNANQEVTIVMLAQGIKETSPEVLEYRKSLQKKPTTAASTIVDKGKAKMEPDSPTLCHGPTTQCKENQATSSSTTKKEKQQRGQQKKVYQPKYPSLRTQQRRNKQVLVPKQMVQACRLSDEDTHRWVEHQEIKGQKSRGWLSTQKSLEAQGYFQGNQSLWLQKPEFTAYIVSSNPQRRQLSTSRSKKKGRQPKQRRQRRNKISAYGHTEATNKVNKIWVPKALLAQISSNGSIKMVLIKAKKETSKAYKEWVVPHNLISAQGYYEGQAQLWVPKDAIDKQEKGPFQRRSQHSNQDIQLKPEKANAGVQSSKVTAPQIQRWMPKNTTRRLQTSSRTTINSGKQCWVPIQRSIDTNSKEKNVPTKEDEQVKVLSSPFFMTINPIYDPSPFQDTDQIIEEILCQWEMQ